MPKAYLLNYNDYGYGVFSIDSYSLKAFQEGLSKVSDDLTRKLIYNMLSIMTKDGKLPAWQYFDIGRL